MNNFALKYKKKNTFELEQKKINQINKNEILIKIYSCGICGSDLKILKKGSHRVKKNTVLGHEMSGEIIFAEPGILHPIDKPLHGDPRSHWILEPCVQDAQQKH